jgi:hypothetical protein
MPPYACCLSPRCAGRTRSSVARSSGLRSARSADGARRCRTRMAPRSSPPHPPGCRRYRGWLLATAPAGPHPARPAAPADRRSPSMRPSPSPGRCRWSSRVESSLQAGGGGGQLLSIAGGTAAHARARVGSGGAHDGHHRGRPSQGFSLGWGGGGRGLCARRGASKTPPGGGEEGLAPPPPRPPPPPAGEPVAKADW